MPHNKAVLENVEPLKDSENKAGKRKRQSDQVGVQSMEMLKVRAALEERLKQEGILSSRASKSDKAQKRLKPVNGQLVMYDDFYDDAIDVGATRFSNGHASSLSTSKLSQIVSTKTNKPKVSKCTWGFYVSNLWSQGTTTGFLLSCCCQRLHSCLLYSQLPIITT